MDNSELKKTSVRANRLEKKRFEMMMSAFDTAKRNVAVDMKKNQIDFKRRLKRYKDRQREIVSARSQESSSDMEEFVLRQLRRRNLLNNRLRPHTSPAPLYHRNTCETGRMSSSDGCGGGTVDGFHGTSVSEDVSGSGSGVGSSGSGVSCNTTAESGGVAKHTAAKGSGLVQSFEEEDEEEEEDIAKLSHCRRSKIDLRPCTAWPLVANNRTGKTDTGNGKPEIGTGSTRSNAPNMKLLQLRSGRLGTPARQIRYFDDEEIEERCTFYRFLLDGYRQMEHEHLRVLNNRVEEFCGKKRQSTICPPLEKTGGVSLPGYVPPIIRHVMSAGGPRLAAWTHQQRAKTSMT